MQLLQDRGMKFWNYLRRSVFSPPFLNIYILQNMKVCQLQTELESFVCFHSVLIVAFQMSFLMYAMGTGSREVVAEYTE